MEAVRRDGRGRYDLPPAEISGDPETAVSQAASWAGVACVRDDGHVYMPVAFLKGVYPDEREFYEKLETGIRYLFDNHDAPSDN